MQSITLPTYPLLYEVRPIVGVVYEATHLSRPRPKIREMEKEDVQKHERSESASAILNSTESRHHRHASAPIVRQEVTDRHPRSKSLGDDFQHTEDRQRQHERTPAAGVSRGAAIPRPIRKVDSNDQSFHVATAQTMGAIRRAPEDSESENQVGKCAKDHVKDNSTSKSIVAPAASKTKHGGYFRIKKTVNSIFSRHHGTGIATAEGCKHSLRKGRCKKCGCPKQEETQIQSGFHCAKGGRSGCASCSTIFNKDVDQEGVEEVLYIPEGPPQIAPLRSISKFTSPFDIEDPFTAAAKDVNENADVEGSHISNKAPRLTPIRPMASFIEEIQGVFLPVDDSDDTSTVSKASVDDLLSSSSPTQCASEYSHTSSEESWTRRHLDTPTSCAVHAGPDVDVGLPTAALQVLQESATNARSQRGWSHTPKPDDFVEHAKLVSAENNGYSKNDVGEQLRSILPPVSYHTSSEILPRTRSLSVLTTAESQATQSIEYDPNTQVSSEYATPQSVSVGISSLYFTPPTTANSPRLPQFSFEYPVMEKPQWPPSTLKTTTTRSTPTPQLFLTPRTSKTSLTTTSSIAVPIIPLDVLDVIANAGVHGDIECQTIIQRLDRELLKGLRSPAIKPRWNKQARYLIRKAHLAIDLDVQMRTGRLTREIVDAVRRQFFPTITQGEKKMTNHVFNSYIHHAVRQGELAHSQATKILLLATGDGNYEESYAERAIFAGHEWFRDATGFAAYFEENVEKNGSFSREDASLYEDMVTAEELAAAAQTLPELNHRVHSYIADVERYMEGDRRPGAFTPIFP
ncbi:uncharacterized protein K460DRAFT_415707 [Cucurbitaria berberidis CBS 394.84]|uniref:Uncharacterized protein n=1 Tax=Cucurbitaria berberidis CBS 394.84 TaxID=1168544 RepID=A0A9P4LB91_9PLEO|nr:uncharacterized protein K460DRAFT_415707 [Cucurbitaria berberidis CBS 394.84]KAF1849321.1 hypothetical protein K460DRAFT_415707 [Cucurbitaria berberidis CBS 394.84]